MKTERASSRSFSEATLFFLSTGSAGVHRFHALAYDLRTVQVAGVIRVCDLTRGGVGSVHAVELIMNRSLQPSVRSRDNVIPEKKAQLGKLRRCGAAGQ